MQSKKRSDRICFKSNTASGTLLKKLAVDILGAQSLLADPGLLVYQLANGTVLEVHTKEAFHPNDIFGKGNTVISFPVYNIEQSVAQMQAAGATTIDGIIRLNDAYAYCHLILGDEQVVGLHEIG